MANQEIMKIFLRLLQKLPKLPYERCRVMIGLVQ